MEKDELRSFIEAVLRQHAAATPEHAPHVVQALEALFGKSEDKPAEPAP
jgi:hypothetical protein